MKSAYSTDEARNDMTSIQSQQPSRTDDHAGKATRRAGKASPSSAGPDAGTAFSSMYVASQRKLRAEALRAERLAAIPDGDAAPDSTAANCVQYFSDDDDYAPAPQDEPPAQGDAGQGQAGQGADAKASMSLSAQIQASPEESPDWLSLASLLPAGADDGVFEVIMPNSAKVGVAVSDLPAGVSYLLMPEDDQLASRLRGHEMELEGYLRRRIRRNVRVAVL
jgi:hypothetical protein